MDDLSALSSLAVVNLSHNALTDISGLGGCVNLAHVDVVRELRRFLNSPCGRLPLFVRFRDCRVYFSYHVYVFSFPFAD